MAQKRRATKRRKAGVKTIVGSEVVLTREVTKIEKVKAVCIAQSAETVTLQFENRGRIITRKYPWSSIRDVSIVTPID